MKYNDKVEIEVLKGTLELEVTNIFLRILINLEMLAFTKEQVNQAKEIFRQDSIHFSLGNK